MSATEWIDKAEGSTARVRRSALTAWAIENKVDSPDILIKRFLKGKDRKPLYESVDKMILAMKAGKDRYGQNTIAKYRATLPKFFRYAGIPVTKEDYNDQVIKVEVVDSDQFLLQPTHAKQLMDLFLRGGNYGMAALFAALVSCGHRISSVLTLRRVDMKLNLRPARVYFKAAEDKEGVSGTSFFSPYTVELVEKHFADVGNAKYWIPAISPGTYTIDPNRPMIYKSALTRMRQAFTMIGLDERAEITGRYLTKPHGFRNTNLNISKGAKYPWDWAEHNVGHRLGTQDSYPGDDAAAKVWGQTVGPAVDKFLHGDENWMPDWTKGN